MSRENSNSQRKRDSASNGNEAAVVPQPSEKKSKNEKGKVDITDLKCDDCDRVFANEIDAIQHFKGEMHMKKLTSKKKSGTTPTGDSTDPSKNIPAGGQNLSSQKPGNTPKSLLDIDINVDKYASANKQSNNECTDDSKDVQDYSQTEPSFHLMSQIEPVPDYRQTPLNTNATQAHQYYDQNNPRNDQSYGTYSDQRQSEPMNRPKNDQPYGTYMDQRQNQSMDRPRNDQSYGAYNHQKQNQSINDPRNDQPHNIPPSVPGNDQYYNNPRNDQSYNTYQNDQRTRGAYPNESTGDPRCEQSYDPRQCVPWSDQYHSDYRGNQSYAAHQNDQRKGGMRPLEPTSDPKNVQKYDRQQNAQRNDQYYNEPTKNDQYQHQYQNEESKGMYPNESTSYSRNDPTYTHQNMPRSEQHYNDPRAEQSYNTYPSDQSTRARHPSESKSDRTHDIYHNTPGNDPRNDQSYGGHYNEQRNPPSRTYSNELSESYGRPNSGRRNSEIYNQSLDDSHRYSELDYDRRSSYSGKSLVEDRISKVKSPKRGDSLALKSFYGNSLESYFNPPENDFVTGGGVELNEPSDDDADGNKGNTGNKGNQVELHGNSSYNYNDYQSSDYDSRLQSKAGYERADRRSSQYDDRSRGSSSFFESPIVAPKKKETLALKNFYGDSLDSYFNPPEKDFCGIIPDTVAPELPDEAFDNDKNNFYNNSPRNSRSLPHSAREESRKDPGNIVYTSPEDFLNDPPDNLMALKESCDVDKGANIDQSDREGSDGYQLKSPDQNKKHTQSSEVQESAHGYYSDSYQNQNYPEKHITDNQDNRYYGENNSADLSKPDDNHHGNYRDTYYSNYNST